MKVLVLVQSIELGRYPELIKAQKETWASVEHPQVEVVFYTPTSDKTRMEDDTLYINSPMDKDNMFIHFTKACIHLLKHDWDYIFKTDNSAYVDKQALVKLLESKPRTKFYGGHPYGGPPIEGLKGFLWGEGVAFSRDVIINLIDIFALNRNTGPEDVIIGRLLEDRFPWDETMLIKSYYNLEEELSGHAYRCRNDNPEGVPFDDDIKAMKAIHESLSVSNVVRS
jgi:hypothetical protein